ncbi:hypothetical protein [Nannocystis pusilla]|uniref:Outer membrane protein beta-barrel domain-containing protein n=1 Tax=Nannocystis pusilla TaxID=889268 RepID=A0ABS7TKK2_9BACT|nr:hypothetical protein [Nannocystis pusilla]MBZ5708729.1 hypothetical protein [Nannocystis pusilla]
MFFRPLPAAVAVGLVVFVLPPVHAAPAGDAADPFADEGSTSPSAAAQAPAEPAGAAEPLADDVSASPDAAVQPLAEQPAPAETDWASFLGRPVILTVRGREMRGRVLGHDAATVAIKESNGAISDLAKANISAVRLDEVARRSDPSLDDAPLRRSETARAARRAEQAEDDAGSFHDRGAYLLVSPGLLAVPFRSPGALFYRWGIGVGGIIPAQSSSFIGAYGFTLEHFVNQQKVTVPGKSFVPGESFTTSSEKLRTHVFRALGEVRLGSGSDKLFGYVLLGAGLAVIRVHSDTSGSALDSTAAAFAFPLGAGLQGMLGDHFLLGFEPRVTLDIGRAGVAAMFDARVTLGAKF